jgi:hypothetical protein
MSQQTHSHSPDDDPSSPQHPVCPTCGVRMWLTLIARFPGQSRMKDRLQYECKVCEGKAILPPLS